MPAENDIDYKQGIVKDALLAQFVLEKNIVSSENSNTSPEYVDFDLYIHLYIVAIKNEILEHNNYEAVLNFLENDIWYIHLSSAQEKIELYALNYVRQQKEFSWEDFTTGFIADDWHTIYLLAELLPLSNASLQAFITWLTIIMDKQKNDGAVGGLGQYIYQWVCLNGSIQTDLQKSLLPLSLNSKVNTFYSPLLSGLKIIQQKENSFYITLLENSIEPENSFCVLAAIGHICKDDNTDIDRFFSCLRQSLLLVNLRFQILSSCVIFIIYIVSN